MKKRLQDKEETIKMKADKKKSSMKKEFQSDVDAIQRNSSMHDQEVGLIKQRFTEKLDQDKKYIELESAQLLEESTDIDS